jgi:hypothetical protein
MMMIEEKKKFENPVIPLAWKKNFKNLQTYSQPYFAEHWK